ncbi:hypothetical protein [Desulfosporosinus metallidurans]|uniref:Uncharacterized protein n=1 Tax=Desulfosporosinus metallidurans TaxID=1888891 RepID=A0A1Q8QNR5_9FIRM|nr:hypothetical protein [Desulfosporosinus metallidurans]OLN28960.1 hypothetical protein DSOL_3771 [Desulfosporosinus metallidurans]
MSEEPAKYEANGSAKNENCDGVDPFQESMQRVAKAHDKLLQRLFGFVPDQPETYVVSRKKYTKAMKSVQQDFDLVEGDPDFILFIFEQLSRSPRFTDLREDKW